MEKEKKTSFATLGRNSSGNNVDLSNPTSSDAQPSRHQHNVFRRPRRLTEVPERQHHGDEQLSAQLGTWNSEQSQGAVTKVAFIDFVSCRLIANSILPPVYLGRKIFLGASSTL